MANLFIAEDDQLVLDLISFRLHRFEHTVRTATDGELALEEILQSLP